jgi:hypothetical protein
LFYWRHGSGIFHHFARSSAVNSHSYVYANALGGAMGHNFFAMRRKFCAIAASKNSSRAPVIPAHKV